MHTVKIEGRRIVPSKIVCVGRNYVAHVSELGNEIPEEMVIFLKPNSSISRELLAVQAGEALHYECELCFMYGNGGFSALGVGLDLTKRDLQSKLKNKGLPWERAKGFDGAALFSDFIRIPDSLDAIEFQLKVNRQTRQTGTVDLMMYKPAEILSEIQSFMTLYDGDIVMTGTPKGVGQVREGDHFEVLIKDVQKCLLSACWDARASILNT